VEVKKEKIRKNQKRKNQKGENQKRESLEKKELEKENNYNIYMNNELLELFLGILITVSSILMATVVLKYSSKIITSPSELVGDIKNLIKKIVLVAFIIWTVGLVMMAYNK